MNDNPKYNYPWGIQRMKRCDALMDRIETLAENLDRRIFGGIQDRINNWVQGLQDRYGRWMFAVTLIPLLPFVLLQVLLVIPIFIAMIPVSMYRGFVNLASEIPQPCCPGEGTSACRCVHLGGRVCR